ncbi:MAG: ABC transporter ATP-binding protein [Christensenellales bacterium]|jgi:ATP-binding cassette subfamily B protein IrtA
MNIQGDRSRSTFGSVLHFAKSCRWKMMFSILCAIVSVAGGFVPYYGVYQIILLFFTGNASMAGVLHWAMVCAAGYLVKFIFYGISTTLSHVSAYTILENIRLALTDRLMKAPLGVVLGRSAGQMKNIIVDRVETIELPLAHMIPEGISNLLLPTAVLAYLFSINWIMALATLVCVPLGALVYTRMMQGFNAQYEKYMQANSEVNSVIVEYVEGIEVIKAFNQSTSSYEKFTNAVRMFKQFTLDWFRSTWKLMNLGGAILPSTLLGALPVGVLLVVNGSLSPAELTMCIILGMSIIGPISWFTTAVNEFKAVQYGMKDANELLSLSELHDSGQPAKLENHAIAFDEVSFAYDEKLGNVLHDISLKVPEGSYAALVGPSGGGKSTVARLLARFWDTASGSIRIGGVDIRDIPLEQLEQNITFVTQDNYLFGASLFENIRVGKPDAGDAEVLLAAKAAQCEEFISRLEHGWGTTAGEAGKQLSGGERQRIAIARAILKDAPIVILDEATAFTDPENEARLQESISTLTKGKTLLVIAHRLSTIAKADQIIVMNEGRIQSSGTHAQLLQSCPLYQGMWETHIGAKGWNLSGADTRKEGMAHV